jgi:hypothetical protein
MPDIVFNFSQNLEFFDTFLNKILQYQIWRKSVQRRPSFHSQAIWHDGRAYMAKLIDAFRDLYENACNNIVFTQQS